VLLHQLDKTQVLLSDTHKQFTNELYSLELQGKA